MFVSWILFGLLPIVGYRYYRWQTRRIHALAAQIDGPRENPILGSAITFFGKKPQEIFNTALALIGDRETPMKFWFGPVLILVLGKPEDVQAILNSPESQDKPYVYKFFRFGNGLFTAPLNIWRSHRKVLVSSFNARILKSFFPVFNEKTAIITNELRAHLGKGEFDVYEYIGRCTLDMVCATTLGTNMNIQEGKKMGDIFMENFEKFLELVMMRMGNVLHHLEFFYKFTKYYKMEINAFEKSFEMSKIVINRKREDELKLSTSNAPHPIDTDEYRKPQIFLDHIFKLSKETNLFDDAALKNHMDTIIFAGYETSALSTSYTILMLAMHPNVQDKVAAEIKEVFYDPNEEIDHETVSRLVYLEMAIKEAMRLLPIAAFTARATTGDVPLVSKNLTIPANVNIVIPVYNMHRDKQQWGPEPELYNPDHFLPENVAKRHLYAYLPFLAGHRICIGHKYAMYSMKIMLAYLLREYKFTTKFTMATLTKKIDTILRLDHKHLVSIEERQF